MDTESIHVEDDGSIPNNRLPFVLYRGAGGTRVSAGWFETTFGANGWSGAWRNGVYPFHHYHSNTHEVLGVYSGSAVIQLGGDKGPKLEVVPGTVMVIPAGGGHKRISASGDFGVVGAYPDGMACDMCYGKTEERSASDTHIASVPIPAADPLFGADGPLLKAWSRG